MKILLINNVHNYTGGANTVYFNTGELLKNRGNEVIYFAMRSTNDIECDYSRYFVENNKKIGRLGFMTSFIYNCKVEKNLRELIHINRPDIAHLHLIYGGLTSAVIKVLREEKIPIVYTVHDYRLICPRITLLDRSNNLCSRCMKAHYYHCITNRCYKGSISRSIVLTFEIYFRNLFYNPLKNIDAFIFVSQFGRNKHIEFNPTFETVYSKVLYNFLDDRIANMFDDSVDTFDSYYLYYGRLAYEKGIETLIKGFARFPNLQLKILGSGPMEEKLVNLVFDLGITNVSFYPHKTGKELFDLVRQAKYICMPSEWYEMLGMTIVEGNSMAVPSISSDIGGLGEIVEDGITGFKFSAGNIESLCSAISKASSLNSHEYQTMRALTKEKCLAKFDSSKHYQNLMEIYNNVIKSKEIK